MKHKYHKFRYSTSAGKGKVHKVLSEFKEGTLHSGKSGKVVKSHKQAMAIALSEARRAGAKIPKKTNKGKKITYS